MKEITRQMIKIYNINDFDFMGYDIKRKESLSFHHLIIPHRESKKYGIGDGYLLWNGAILVQETSHEYLHIIENKDYEIFCRLTSEMIDMNIKGYLDIENLRYIKDILLYFEKEHNLDRNSKGRPLIKREYTQNRFNWDK